MTLAEMHNIQAPAGMEVFLLTCYFLASIAERCPALKANTYFPEKCLKTVLFFSLLSGKFITCLIDFSDDLCGDDARVGYFYGPGLVSGQKAMLWRHYLKRLSDLSLEMTDFSLFFFFLLSPPHLVPLKAL